MWRVLVVCVPRWFSVVGVVVVMVLQLLPVVCRYMFILHRLTWLHSSPLPLFISCLVHQMLNLESLLIVHCRRSPDGFLCC